MKTMKIIKSIDASRERPMSLNPATTVKLLELLRFLSRPTLGSMLADVRRAKEIHPNDQQLSIVEQAIIELC
jgi:hypothetical protein